MGKSYLEWQKPSPIAVLTDPEAFKYAKVKKAKGLSSIGNNLAKAAYSRAQAKGSSMLTDANRQSMKKRMSVVYGPKGDNIGKG